LDSKDSYRHSVQLLFRNSPTNEVIDFIYEKIRTDKQHPVYEFVKEGNQAIVKLSIDIDAVVTNGPSEKDIYSNLSTGTKNKKLLWNLEHDNLFFEASYEIPAERFFETIVNYSLVFDLFLIALFATFSVRPKQLGFKPKIKTVQELKKGVFQYSDRIKNAIVEEINGIKKEPHYLKEILQFIESNRNCWIVGERGIGKSVICRKIYEKFTKDGKTTLLLRSDEITRISNFDDATLIKEIGITLPELVEKITGEDDFYLIIDSVEGIARNDQVWSSFVTGLSSLLENIRVHTILTIRNSDFRVFPDRYPPSWGNEYNLTGFTKNQINAVVTQLGLKEKISEGLYSILEKPFYLFILAEIVNSKEIVDYSQITNNSHFFQKHFDVVVKKNEDSVTGELKIKELFTIANEMSKQKKLKISKTNFSSAAYRSLCTNGVLVEELHDVHFVHDMYFDYIMTLQIVEKDIVQFLESTGTNFFLKSTINFTFGYLKSKDFSEYLQKIEIILTSEKINEYWKLEALEFLATLDDVTEEEQKMLEKVLDKFTYLQYHFLRYLANNKSKIWFTYWGGTVFKKWSEGDYPYSNELAKYLAAVGV